MGLALAMGLAACGSGGSDASVSAAEAGGSILAAGDDRGRAYPPADRPVVPEISGELLDGSAYSLSELAGSVVVLNFWGSWCGPCRAEAPELQQVYEATRAGGVEFLGVNVKDQRPLALAFVANKGLEFPSLFDTGGSVALQLRQTPPNAIPSTLVLDRRHRVAAVWLGPVAAEQLQPVVTALAEEAA